MKPAGKPHIDEDDAVDAKRNPALARHMMSPGRSTGPLTFKEGPRDPAPATGPAVATAVVPGSTDDDVVSIAPASSVLRFFRLAHTMDTDEGHALCEPAESALKFRRFLPKALRENGAAFINSIATCRATRTCRGGVAAAITAGPAMDVTAKELPA